MNARERQFDARFVAEVSKESEAEVSPEMLTAIGGAIGRIEEVAKVHATEKSARYRGIEFTDTNDIYFLTSVDNDENFGLSIYKDDAEPRVMENRIADFTYFAPDHEKQRVYLQIRSDGITRRFYDMHGEEKMRQLIVEAGEGAIKDGAPLEESVPGLHEVAEKRDDDEATAQAFEEMTGLADVTEPMAQELLKTLKRLLASLEAKEEGAL